MRTLGDMKYNARRLVNDVADDVFLDPTVERAISDALEALARDLLINPIGKRILRKHSAGTSLTADTEEYAVPEDNLKIDRVQFQSDNTSRWQTLEYRPPQPGKTPPPLYWFDDAGLMNVRVWPSYSSISNNEEIRFRYYAKLPMPTTDEGTLNDPDGSGTDDTTYPPELDSCAEYRAAVILATEENLNTVPIQHFLSTYNRYVQALVQGVPMTYPDRQYRSMMVTQNEEES